MTHAELRDKANHPMKVYVGFDPTADSLHLGNLVGIMGLAWFQRFGHTPVALLGGATGRIGDPSGKSSERPLLDDETLEHNMKCLHAFFHKILKFPTIVNNNDWYKNFSVLDFLRDVGKHFRVGTMIAKESVRTRLQSEEGMSFTEFSYQILQGYDFHYLNKHHGVTLQMGGSDQWGNITAGTEFHRKLGGDPVYGLTFPLLTRSDGKKFGKSEEGAIWLSGDKLSPYQFYQYLVRVPDADVVRLLKMLTFLELEEIAEIEAQMAHTANLAQRRLAEEVTRFVHGEEGLEAALRATEGMAPGSAATLTKESLEQMSGDVPGATLPYNEVIGQKYVDVAARIALVSSKGEGVRLIKNGGAYLNNNKISDPALILTVADLIGETYILFSAGKKKRMLVSVFGKK